MRRIPDGAPILTVDAMRAAEACVFASGVTQDELIERAGAAVAAQVARLACRRPILVLAGPGNNGGDGYVAARWLAERGHDVIVAAMAQNGDGAAVRMRARWTGPTADASDAPSRPVVVDALFGIGLDRPLDGETQALLTRLRAESQTVIAIDIPSGLGADDGRDLGAVNADVTVALGALKGGHVLDAGVERCGHVVLCDIGVAASTDCHTIARPALSAPRASQHKYSRGMVAIVSGAMPGAARLAARAALQGGAGYVVVTGSDTGLGPDALVHRSLDQTLSDERIGALVVGPGLGRGVEAQAVLERVLASGRPLVVDGDALSLLGASAADRLADCRAVLTPHSGEFDRMFAQRSGSKIDRTLAAARQTGCTIVHKGADTVIADPVGRVTVAAASSPWLSTAGTGDVLAGLVAAHMAGGRDAEGAVWLHGRCAELSGPAFIADDLIAAIPLAIEECL